MFKFICGSLVGAAVAVTTSKISFDSCPYYTPPQVDLHKNLKEKINTQDKQDKVLHFSSQKNNIIKVFPLQADIINTFKDEDIIDNLSYISVMYEAPLKPYQRIAIRREVAKIIDKYKLTKEQVTFLQHFLEHYKV